MVTFTEKNHNVNDLAGTQRVIQKGFLKKNYRGDKDKNKEGK